MFVVTVEFATHCQTFLGEIKGVPSAKKPVERIDFIETDRVSLKLTFISFRDVLSSCNTDLRMK